MVPRILRSSTSPVLLECLDWLNKQSSSSVLYVSFGTTSSLWSEQARELPAGGQQPTVHLGATCCATPTAGTSPPRRSPAPRCRGVRARRLHQRCGHRAGTAAGVPLAQQDNDVHETLQMELHRREPELREAHPLDSCGRGISATT